MVQWRAEQRAYPQNLWCRHASAVHEENASLTLADVIKLANERFASRAIVLEAEAAVLNQSGTASDVQTGQKRAASSTHPSPHATKKVKSSEHVDPEDRAQDEVTDDKASEEEVSEDEAPAAPAPEKPATDNAEKLGEDDSSSSSLSEVPPSSSSTSSGASTRA
ncbi:hypothetical protein KEM55_002178 [Ascosphaera atra]|nr:hypothetical protein KEM55_002178 [Ascosphaera atra]